MKINISIELDSKDPRTKSLLELLSFSTEHMTDRPPAQPLNEEDTTSLADVRLKIKEKKTGSNVGLIKDFLSKYNAKTVSALPEEFRAEFIKFLDTL